MGPVRDFSDISNRPGGCSDPVRGILARRWSRTGDESRGRASRLFLQPLVYPAHSSWGCVDRGQRIPGLAGMAMLGEQGAGVCEVASIARPIADYPTTTTALEAMTSGKMRTT